MRGVVVVDDGAAVHVIPRAEVRHAEVVQLDGDGWALRYQLAGAEVVRAVEWRDDCRPASLRDKIDAGAYNRIAAGALQTTITRGHRDLHLERRSDRVFLVRSGLVEDDDRVALCRRFIAEMALTAVQTALGPLDEIRRQLLWEIKVAASDLVLPDWYPLAEDRHE